MYRSGFVGLIGQPNAGKSSLMNLLVQEKVSIVTPKPQTTRRRVLGIVSNDEGQAVFVDAPGVLKASKGLNAFLTREAEDVISQSDLLIAVISTDTESKEQAQNIIDMVLASKKPWFAVLTKVDMIEFKRRVDAMKEMCALHSSCMGVIESSTTWTKADAKSVRDEILRLCFAKLPESPKPLYDIELFTPHNVKDLVAEIVREQCFEVLHHEIPYNIAVRIQKFDESDPKMPKIHAEILVAKESHKPILIGKGGVTIKEIGMLARKSIEKMMDQKVFLGLEVSVRENWFENKMLMKELGYVVE
ncbi:MAG: GTPase Era [Pseudobdellovibrionaceae bacterium]